MEPRRRKRGIKASREKLEIAMLQRGFDTQTALADEIARNENLSKPPKDLVNKVFREQGVSTHNLARIANALGVEAHTIYLAKDDSQFDTVANEQFISSAKGMDKSVTELSPGLVAQQNQVKSKYTTHFFLLFSTMTIGAILFFWFFSFDSPATSTRINSPLGKVLLIVQTPETTRPLASNLVKKLQVQEGINATVSSNAESFSVSAKAALKKWQAHLVIKFSLVKGQYYQLLQVHIDSKSHHKELLQIVLRQSELAASQAELSQYLAQQINRFVMGEALIPVATKSNIALEFYLKGKDLLFVSHGEVEFNKAKTLFLNAIALDSTYVPALAELCRIHVRLSAIKDERHSLEEAARYCNLVKKLAPDSLFFISAQAELLSRTGEIERALVLTQEAITPATKNADALALMAELFLVSNARPNKVNSNEQQINLYAQGAIKLAADHWRAYNTLGNFYFSVGDIHTAKQHFLEAVNVVKQDVILSNLGTMQLCYDELTAAQSTYLDLINHVENNYLGHENLGTVYLFKYQYELALTHKLIAIEKQPEISIHQTWASLAEVYLRLGRITEAASHYAKALTHIERDELLENVTVSDQLFKLYYRAKLNQMAASNQALPLIKEEVNRFITNKNQLGLKARSHLAWLAGYSGDAEAKEEIWQQISDICPVYQRLPELVFE